MDGATSSSIDIYSNGVLIVTVPNNGFHPDVPNGRGHATYTYKVCEAGTGNCSNQVAVNFEIPGPTLKHNAGHFLEEHYDCESVGGELIWYRENKVFVYGA